MLSCPSKTRWLNPEVAKAERGTTVNNSMARANETRHFFILDSSILSEKADFTINFSTLDKSNTSIGKLKFAASGKELNAKTTNVALNHSFTLPNKTKIITRETEKVGDSDEDK